MSERKDFVPDEFKSTAVEMPNMAIPLMTGMTVPGESVTRLMAELLGVEAGRRVLVIGTGSGYQTAYLAERYGVLVDSLDIRGVVGLAEKMPAGVRLFAMDGLVETPNEIYDAVMVTCAVPYPCMCWMAALREGGILVAPVGGRESQAVRKYVRTGLGLEDVGDFAYGSFVAGETLVSPTMAMSVYDAVKQ